ncbi:MAG: site-specific integrase [Bacilli bacterium]|nr:site-specific integrase [Bacilli bacterium]
MSKKILTFTVDNKLYFTIFNFMYFTGLRIGEMIALIWKDIVLNKKTLNINKNYTNKLGTNSHKIVDPKTKNSIRIIDLDDDIVDLLKKHYDNEKQIYGFNNNMSVFGNVRYITPTTFARYLTYYIKKSGVKKITPHGFRHSYVSLLFYLGCDSRDIAARVGDTI